MGNAGKSRWATAFAVVSLVAGSIGLVSPAVADSTSTTRTVVPVAAVALTPAKTSVKVWRSQTQQTYGSSETATIKIRVSAANNKTPTGVVAVRSGGKPMARIKLDAEGRAQYKVPANAPGGLRTYVVVYEPYSASTFATSTSESFNIRINKAVPTMSVDFNPAVLPYGKGGTATVTVAKSGLKVTGKVVLKLGTKMVSTGTLSATGKVLLKTAKLPLPGTSLYTVIYAGNKNFDRVAKDVSVNVRSVTPKLSLSLSKSAAKTTESVTATITASSAVTVDGQVRLLVGGTYYGPANLVNGKATITIPANQTAGKVTVAAQYLESVKFRTAWSAQQTIDYSKPAVVNPCPVSAIACVNLTNETAWLQHNGNIVYGPVPMTAGQAGYRTNPGLHTVFWKHKDHKSSIFNNAPMPNSVFFDNDIAFHQGSLYVQSHGCIHLSWEASEYFFNYLSVGDRVAVFGVDPY